MPIKDLSERRRLPRLGKIHLGIMVKSNKACNCKKNGNPEPNCRVCKGTGFIHYPKEVDHFVCPKEVEAVFGPDPKELKIMFPVENQEVFFQQWYKRYGFELLKCMGDGNKAMTWDEKDGCLKQIDCPCEELEKKRCSISATLQFLLPDVPGAGVWQINTGSKNSIIDINSSIDYIREICGRIKLIPLVLKRVETKTSRVENGNLKKGIHYTLQIDVDNISLRQLQQAAQIAPEKILLPPPDTSKDELFNPPMGFKPEENGETEEENKPQEETEDFEVLKHKLDDIIQCYKDLGGELTDKEGERIDGLEIEENVEKYHKAIEYFGKKLKKLEPEENQELPL